MPRQKSFVSMIRDLVRDEIQRALDRLFEGLGSVGVGPTRIIASSRLPAASCLAAVSFSIVIRASRPWVISCSLPLNVCGPASCTVYS